MFRVVALACGGLIVCAPTASAQPIQTPVVSTFDQGLDDWTLPIGQIASIQHVVTGGVPGGYVRFTEGGTGRTDIEAPGAYLGDWSQLDGNGILRFDHKVFELGGLPLGPPYHPYEVVLYGAGGSVARFVSSATAQLTWTPVTVLIDESFWTVESGDWVSLLSDVNRLQIRIELVGNNGLPDDEDGIDNVVLMADTTATGVEGSVLAASAGTGIRKVYPNPFRRTVQLEFDTVARGTVRLTVHDTAGRLVRRLVDGECTGATHVVAWNGRDERGIPVAAGVYYATLTGGGGSSVRRIVRLQ